MTVEIIIPTIGARPDLLDVCLKQLRATCPEAIVTVESGGTFAENCNAAASRSTADLLVFLNDDTEPQPGWLQALCQPFIDDDTVAITGARLTYPDGTLQHAGVYLMDHDGTIHGHNHQTERPSGPVDAVTGACLAIPRCLFDDLERFDAGYRNGNEDLDLCLKAQLHGWTVWYAANSNVIHHESQSGPARWTHVNENVQRFQDKWRLAKQNS